MFRFFFESLLQPLIYQRLNLHAALCGLFFDLVHQFKLNRNRADDFKLGVWCVCVKLGEVVGVPELANLLVRVGFGNIAQSMLPAWRA